MDYINIRLAFSLENSLTMHRNLFIFISVLAASGLMGAAPPAATPKIPLVFEPNTGQAPAEAKWLARGPGYQLFFYGPRSSNEGARSHFCYRHTSHVTFEKKYSRNSSLYDNAHENGGWPSIAQYQRLGAYRRCQQLSHR